ncbi:MAG: RNA-guided endonuclease InsQ/TnpB family protein [Candidatus Hodarchaeota archaeon]
MMKLVKRVQLPATRLLEGLCTRSNNLYNVAMYYTRQEFFHLGNWLRYGDLYFMLRSHHNYTELDDLAGSQVPQQVLKQVDKAWKGFFNAMKVWRKEPGKFRGTPRPPRYRKKGGKNVVTFTGQQSRIKDGHCILTKKMIEKGMVPVPTSIEDANLHCVRIVPHGDRYIFEIVHKVECKDLGLDKGNSIGLDIGLNNLVTTSDGIIVKGGAVKSTNQYYNKQLAKQKSIIKKVNDKGTSKAIDKLTRKRNDKIAAEMHGSSRIIINHCITSNIGTLFIGYNEGWKDNINIGKRNNQNFVQVPFLQLVEQLEYKAMLVGIDVQRINEEFTSQVCSRCGRRNKANRKYRGLYICDKCSLVINADVNGARNIDKKGLREQQPVLEAAGKVADRGGLDPPVGTFATTPHVPAKPPHSCGDSSRM